MHHDHVVVVSVGAGGREDDGEDKEDEVRVSDPHGAVTSGQRPDDSCHPRVMATSCVGESRVSVAYKGVTSPN